jgi:NAD(P)H-hydrate epimerase
MMKIVTALQMRNIDRRTIQEAQIPGLDLMERAGQGVARVALEMLGDAKGKKVVHFCGKGNNGGDGFVVARLLAQKGAIPQVFLLGKKAQVKGDAKENLDRLLQLGVKVEELAGIQELSGLEKAQLIVDALLGTGASGSVKGLMAQVIGWINDSGLPVLAVDIPSGVEADNGEILSCSVRAQQTVTMALPKRGFFFSPGREQVGALRVVDIGVPSWVVDEEGLSVETLSKQEMAQLIPSRFADAHKGSCGRVLVVAGSVGMTGAAALTSMAVLRSGAGMAILGVPESLNQIMEVKLTEVMTRPLPETKTQTLALASLEAIQELLSWADVLAIGPGLSSDSETVQVVCQLLPKMSCPTVVDADGLNAIAQDSEILKSVKAPLVLTPHAGELARLNGIEIPLKAGERIEAAVALSRRHGVVCVFKGAPTLIADEKGQVCINTTGNAGMATAGAGDVLTGMIAGFLAQGLTCPAAAKLGVYLHGLAGDVARDARGEWGVVAGDLVEAIPEAIFRTCGQRAKRREAGHERWTGRVSASSR